MPKTVLIVDDSSFLSKQIAEFFTSQLGFQVVAIGKDGNEAVDLYRKHKPDLVTMDLTMPEMDGIECIRQIRAIDPKVRILVVSALSDKATAIQALKEGAQGFLDKPFTEAELSDAIGELLGESGNG